MKSIFLSAGHSDSDPGAVRNGRREADIAVEFRNMVSFYLQREGVKHELDGNGTTNLPLTAAVKKAAHNQIAVEFHCNSAISAEANGTETLSAPEDMTLGSKLAKAVADALLIKNRGAKPEGAGHHHRLAFVQAGGIIVELFFITNVTDLSRYDKRKWLAARAVAGVLMDEANR